MTVKEYNGILIDYSRDNLLEEQGLALLTRPGFYKKENEESPQETFARAATCYSFGDYELAQRLYDAASQGWFTFASPVLSNAVSVDWPTFSDDEFEEAAEWLEENVTPDGLPISCFLSYVPDTKEGLVSTRTETAWLSMMGGGIGVYMSNRSPDEKSTGVMSHLKGYDADALSYKQTATRRGSVAAYLDIDHPEIMSFIQMRNPAGGDVNKKCFNLNNAVNITDKFMEAVVEGGEYELIDPKHGPTGRFLNAREVWEELLEMRLETGEPYLHFIDTVNRNKPDWITKATYHVSQSNLCVAPETMILTDRGNFPIAELENQNVNVWNGEEFSEVTIRKTGENQKLIKVITDSGQILECTPYHKFYVMTGYNKPSVEKRAGELEPGDKLIKFDLPVVEGTKVLDKAYTNGFFSADGCFHKGVQFVDLYHDKRDLIDHIEGVVNSYEQKEQKRIRLTCKGLKDKFFVPDSNYTIQSRLEWLAGYLDGDGCIYRNGSNEQVVGCSIEFEFLREVQMMLQTLGVESKIQTLREEGLRLLPKNDGSGELGRYNCKKTWRLIINSNGLYKLHCLGINFKRLETTKRKPQRSASHFIKVEEVIDEGRTDDTFCFTESKRNMGMFGGILTGNCSEIELMTSHKRTAVCCLSSLNLEKYDEWKDTTLVQDLTRMLDNVLEYFIRLAPPELKRAVYSASKERAIGLGALGWHSYLQSKMIPFESGGFNSAAQYNVQIFDHIKNEAIQASKQLAKERGEPDDVAGSGMRNSHLLAIAPNASSSKIAGTSPSIEPWASNAFNEEGRAGSFLVKNKYLKKLLQEKGKDTDEVWDEVISNSGSVAGLDFLSDHEKKVFATAREINPMWIIEHASMRQPFICQSQSVNLFHDGTWTAQELSDIHFASWKKGLKGLYYLRGIGAKSASVGTGQNKPLNALSTRPTFEYEECLSCSG